MPGVSAPDSRHLLERRNRKCGQYVTGRRQHMTPATMDSIPSANTRAAAGARRSFTRRDARLPSRQRPHLNVNMLAQVRKLDPAARLLISPCAPYPARHPRMAASSLASRGRSGDWYRNPRMSASGSASRSQSGDWHWHPACLQAVCRHAARLVIGTGIPAWLQVVQRHVAGLLIGTGTPHVGKQFSVTRPVW